jgi:hypothetical protein
MLPETWGSGIGFTGSTSVGLTIICPLFAVVGILMYSAEITQMPLTSIQIQALVREMDYSMRRHKGLKQTNPTEYRNKVVAENQMLYNDMPSIFEMHITGKLDGTFFDMLAMRRQIEKGELTEDEASRQVGQKLFDRYVKPVIGDDVPPDQRTGAHAPAPAPVVKSYAEYYKEDVGMSGPSS